MPWKDRTKDIAAANEMADRHGVLAMECDHWRRISDAKEHRYDERRYRSLGRRLEWIPSPVGEERRAAS